MYTDEASQTEALQISFAEMRGAGWDPDADLLWGYFFVDRDLQKLGVLRVHLERIGFTFVEVFEIGDENDEPSGEHMLHVERVEIHGPASLARRNVELTDLAFEFHIRAYDGWDVGKISSPEIVR
jgi:hypothetical protein